MNKFITVLRIEKIEDAYDSYPKGISELVNLDYISRITKFPKESTSDSGFDRHVTYIVMKDGTEIMVADSIRTLEARIELLKKSNEHTND